MKRSRAYTDPLQLRGLWDVLFFDRIVLAHWVIWSCSLALAFAFNFGCSYGDINMQSSTERCLRRKGDTDLCQVPFGPSCPSLGTIRMISPAAVSKFLVEIGPTPMWGLVCYVCYRRGLSLVAKVLLTCLGVFIATVDVFRYCRIIWPSFDPSGHTFIFGMQLIPWWFLHMFSDSLKHEHAANDILLKVVTFIGYMLEIVLIYFNFSTAAFFHYISEALAAWVTVTICVILCSRYLRVHAVEGDCTYWTLCGDVGARSPTFVPNVHHLEEEDQESIWEKSRASPTVHMSMSLGRPRSVVETNYRSRSSSSRAHGLGLSHTQAALSAHTQAKREHTSSHPPYDEVNQNIDSPKSYQRHPAPECGTVTQMLPRSAGAISAVSCWIFWKIFLLIMPSVSSRIAYRIWLGAIFDVIVSVALWFIGQSVLVLHSHLK